MNQLLQNKLKTCPGSEIPCHLLIKYFRSGSFIDRLRNILIYEHLQDSYSLIVKSTSCRLIAGMNNTCASTLIFEMAFFASGGPFLELYVWPLYNTRVMFSKGMISKSKYWISEKNKGMSVSICPHFKGIFQSQYSHFQIMYCKVRLWSRRVSTGFLKIIWAMSTQKRPQALEFWVLVLCQVH